MCAVILKSEKLAKDIPMNWKYGIDITKFLDDNGVQAELFERNCGPGQAMAGGPTCFFRGKEIPTFVGTGPKASITSKLLAAMLEFMDRLDIWDRKEGKTPFLLLDGHHSRLELPFLDYIFDKSHEWSVCIGVPYGTHLWQVADSSELNGCFKMSFGSYVLRNVFRHHQKCKKGDSESWLGTVELCLA